MDHRQFSFFYNAIENGATRREKVSLDLFDFDDCDLILDIGAHFGLYTIIFGVQNPDATIVAYEPNEYNKNTCQMQIKQNGLAAEVQQAAVSDEDGTATLALSDREVFGLNWFESSVGHRLSTSTSGGRTESVDVISIDTILDNYDANAPFIKIDAEGAEYEIMRTLLERPEPIRGFVELHPDFINDGSAFDIICWLDEHGKKYEIVKDHIPTRPGIYFE